MSEMANTDVLHTQEPALPKKLLLLPKEERAGIFLSKTARS